MQAEPKDEHRWLDRLVGEWTVESECVMGPDQPPSTFTGEEVVRSIGGLWVVAEGTGAMPDGGCMNSIMTLGFDGCAGRFTGTFIASVMTHLWVYDGALDEGGKVLTLNASGPAFDGKGTASYRDVIEIIDDNHRVMTSEVLNEDGSWTRFMTINYRRKASASRLAG